MEERKAEQALENLTVLDLTRVVAGPYAGALLGDLGANVIKIEIPGRGDDARGYGPYENGVLCKPEPKQTRNYFKYEIRKGKRSIFEAGGKGGYSDRKFPAGCHG